MDEREEKERLEILQYLIGRMCICSGYDAQTREELIEELLELEAA